MLRVEKYDEPTEIVIHVDMLKEGWDVNNLYTIIPLKAADSKILVEQSIGRGLRLPFGECTGVDAIDRLNIIAHDKFQAIVKAAEDQQFEFQKIQLEENSVTGKVKAVDNVSLLEQQITRIISEQIVSPAEKKTSESTIEDKKATLETAPIQRPWMFTNLTKSMKLPQQHWTLLRTLGRKSCRQGISHPRE